MISADPKIREFLLRLSYKEQELLSGIAEGKSVRRMAEDDKLGNERTLASNLMKLDEAFKSWTGHALVENPGGRRGFQITDWGRKIAAVLREHHRRLTDDLISVVNAPDEIEVAVTNDCLEEFGDLQEHLAKNADFTIRPKVWRTADIYEYATAGKSDQVGPCAFYSTVAPGDQQDKSFHRGDLINIDTRPGKIKQLLVLKTSDFELLAPRDGFGFTEPVDLQEVLEARWELVVPEGGAVYDFLGLRLGQWNNVGCRLTCTDLNASLDILRYGLRPQRYNLSGSIMIVHGLAPARIPPGYTNYAIQPLGGRPPHQAVTGLMRDDGQLRRLPAASVERWDTVWDQAIKLWRNDAG